MLKADLHTHINLDPIDEIEYSYQDLINKAAELHYDVLAITCHDKVVVTTAMKEYARTHNILLISGAELTIEGNHVLVYNITEKDRASINTLEDLQKLKDKNNKNKDILIIAPHPFHYKSFCLKDKIVHHLNLFDAWEYSFFYHRFWDPNNKTLKLATKYSKPLIANGDVHDLCYFGRNYTSIDSIKEEKKVIEAIKQGKTKVVTHPLSTFDFFALSFWVVTYPVRKLKKYLKSKNIFKVCPIINLPKK